MRLNYALGTAALCTMLALPTAAEASTIGGCYGRVDAGYGWSASDDAIARITPAFGTAIAPVQAASLDGNWFGEIGFGCSLFRSTMVGGSMKDEGRLVTSPTGWRGEMMFGFHGKRQFDGVPVNPPLPPPTFVDPVHAHVHTNTLMFNVYYDFPKRLGVVPYLGGGIGMAFAELHDVTFTNGVVVRLSARDETNFAWSLMAGLAVDIGSNIMLDVGYRYLDMGDIGVANPAIGYSLKISDISEHQMKVGLRIPLQLYRW